MERAAGIMSARRSTPEARNSARAMIVKETEKRRLRKAITEAIRLVPSQGTGRTRP